MERESSNEEVDHEHRAESPVRATFQIDDVNNETANTRRFNKWYYYFLAIIVPVFIIILYFNTDVNNLFKISIMNANYDVSINRMLESELQALYMLRQQQLGLFKLLNNTLLNNTLNATSNKSIANNSDFEDLKLDLLSQISLNKRIREALLSSHRLGNLLNASDYAIDASLDGYGGLHRCKKVDYRLSGRRTIEWKPRLDKYLFAICVSGQMSNHLICLEKHMFFAALLNRILIIPSSRVDYEFRRVLDIDHINKCVGREVVVTFEEFAKSRKGHMHIDKFVCYFSKPQPCFLDDERVKKLKSLGVSMNKLEAAWDEDVKNLKPRTVQDIMTNNTKKPSCFYPVPQAADCINRVVERSTAPVIYLSTDAAESETGLLQSVVVVNGRTVPLVRRPARNSAEKWDALLYRHGLEGDRQVEAMLDKTICALSDVFIGSMGSTSTEDILRLRKGWGSASVCDEYLCLGEVPNFIADDE
ncbi:hypothetical protein RND71_013541 [Anisodus tanguticus]|uniref:O-fucosyltransferase family protein n=1 Tax=Anisodus tanguticus TaxID=243964 RepID=A0AAE1SAX3_9SOLA|nr:hypothetical protein RND71_013541 [Anisodus tanguticus]